MKNKFLNQLGLTLIEIVVAVSISSLIIIAVYSMFLMSKEAYKNSETDTEILQNGRVCLERMTREIRQAQDIVTNLPDSRVSAENEVEFHDGHLTSVTETDSVQDAASANNEVNLNDANASSEDDYYKDMFIKITGGDGAGEIKRIISYVGGSTKKAVLDSDWTTKPNGGSTYMIDSSYYYIRYYLDGDNLNHQIKIYYFDADPNSYVPKGAIDGGGNPPSSAILEDGIVGEHISNLEIWGDDLISIVVELQKDEKTLNLSTKIWGRNL